MGYVAFKEERFFKRDGEGDEDVFMGKMMKFQNKRVRERWIVGVLLCGLVLFI